MRAGRVKPGRFFGKTGKKIDRTRMMAQRVAVCRRKVRVWRHEQQDQQQNNHGAKDMIVLS
ncbi:hypothetical protein DPF_2597 [Desulfoplanes formicivorans]|uniref:Uncharacterized protein n=1 Tax=Desulfoplanes formicivorans TaxID=1592317 RepID=A0A194ALF3_9BACT|nr:hypothetical protein DPF_2597 [Desulfoplanes formicivorans]